MWRVLSPLQKSFTDALYFSYITHAQVLMSENKLCFAGERKALQILCCKIYFSSVIFSGGGVDKVGEVPPLGDVVMCRLTIVQSCQSVSRSEPLKR